MMKKGKMLALKKEEGAVSPEMRESSGNWKGQGNEESRFESENPTTATLLIWSKQNLLTGLRRTEAKESY